MNTPGAMAALLGTILLGGCVVEPELDDLRAFTENAFKDHQPEVEPLPPLKPHAVFIYTASDEIDPFDVENLKELWKVTLIEDIWIVENNHLGVMSRSYGPGRYADNETYTTDFIKWYMAEVAQG